MKTSNKLGIVFSSKEKLTKLSSLRLRRRSWACRKLSFKDKYCLVFKLNVIPASKVLFDELEDLDTKLKQFKADAKEEATSVKVEI